MHRVMLLLLSAAVLCGCAAPFHLAHDGQWHPAEWRSGKSRPAGIVPDIKDHVIAVDGQGIPHDPSSPDGQPLSMKAFRTQIANMLLAMRSFHAGRADRKVLIFVHGGLNRPADSLTAADSELEQLMDEGYFPIFLNWNSDLLDSYGEHITQITQGQTDKGLGRALLSPLYVFADVGRAVTRAPVVWANQIGSDVSAANADIKALSGPHEVEANSDSEELANRRWANTRHGKVAAAVLMNLRRARSVEQSAPLPSGHRTEIRAYMGPDLDVDAGHLADLEAAYIITSPTKFGLSWIIDGLGTPAWENMSRRTLMAFDGQLGGNPSAPGNPIAQTQASVPRELRAENAQTFDTSGALAIFRHEFLSAIPAATDHSGATTAPSRPYELTLIGHSMGTMVLNEWLRRDILERRQRFYANIVYMAAACSVRDFGRAVVPYLLQHGPDPRAADPAEAAGTQFYNLTLHPLADLRERERAYDIPPRGSLLVWLDDFLSEPQTPLDRTLGRWDNIIAATELIPRAVRGQVSLKAFALAPYGDSTPPANSPDYGPQGHGQFRGRAYWRREFWYSETAVIPPPPAE